MAGRQKRIVGTAREDWYKNPDKERQRSEWQREFAEQRTASTRMNPTHNAQSQQEKDYLASKRAGAGSSEARTVKVNPRHNVQSSQEKEHLTKKTSEQRREQPGERQYQSGDRGGSYSAPARRPGGSYNSQAVEQQRKDNESKRLQSKLGSTSSRGDSLYSRDSTTGQTKKVEKKTTTKKSTPSQQEKFADAFRGASEEEKKKRQKMGSRNNNW